MYSPSWLSDQSLIDSLQQAPWRWQSAQAVRVIEQTGLSQTYTSAPSCNYPHAEISRVQRTERGWTLTSTLPALTGVNGVLPYVYQDLAEQYRLARDDYGMADFLAVFNNRILGQTHQIQLRSSLMVRYEKYVRKGLVQAHQILAISGLMFPKYIPAANLTRYSAVLARKTTNLDILTLLLRDYFSLEFQLKPPPAVRMPLSPDCLSQLHTRVDHRSRCVGYLGDAILGNSCYLLHSCIHVVIVINTLDEYHDVTRDQSLAPAIIEMCLIYFARVARFRLQIECPRHCLVSPVLSARPWSQVARLGRLSCLMPEIHPEQRVIVDFPESSTR